MWVIGSRESRESPPGAVEGTMRRSRTEMDILLRLLLALLKTMSAGSRCGQVSGRVKHLRHIAGI